MRLIIQCPYIGVIHALLSSISLQFKVKEGWLDKAGPISRKFLCVDLIFHLVARLITQFKSFLIDLMPFGRCCQAVLALGNKTSLRYF